MKVIKVIPYAIAVYFAVLTFMIPSNVETFAGELAVDSILFLLYLCVAYCIDKIIQLTSDL